MTFQQAQLIVFLRTDRKMLWIQLYKIFDEMEIWDYNLTTATAVVMKTYETLGLVPEGSLHFSNDKYSEIKDLYI